LYYFCKWFFSGKDRTVLVPVDQLNKQASADPLSSLESLMVSAVSRDYLGVQASFQKSRASSKLKGAAIVLFLAVATAKMATDYVPADNYYKVLEVSRSSSASDIKRAFRTMSLKMHPDKISQSATAEEKAKGEDNFIRIKEAYDALAKPKPRKIYEQHGKAGIECMMDKSSVCNVSEEGAKGYLVADIYGHGFYLLAAVFTVLATGQKKCTWTTQMSCIASMVTVLLVEANLRGAFSDGTEEFDLPNFILGENTKHEKCIYLRCVLIPFVLAAVIWTSLTAPAADEDINKSYFNALLLQQREIFERLQAQDEQLSRLGGNPSTNANGARPTTRAATSKA